MKPTNLMLGFMRGVLVALPNLRMHFIAITARKIARVPSHVRANHALSMFALDVATSKIGL
jgi:hypothetical protein